MAERPMVLILSNDELLRELLSERFRQDHLRVCDAKDLAEAATVSAEHSPNVVVIDAITDSYLAAGVLDDPYGIFGQNQPPFMLLAGSATPSAVRDHGWIDRTVAVPVSSDTLVEAAIYCGSGRARREMRSGIRARAAVTETFKTKTGSV